MKAYPRFICSVRPLKELTSYTGRMTEARFGPLVHEALEYALLSRACANGSTRETLCRYLDGGSDALEVALANAYLRWQGELLLLTLAGEDRLDHLFLRLHAQPSGDLTMRVLRLLSAIGPLGAEQMAMALGVSAGAAQRAANELAADGLLTRSVKAAVGRGRGRHIFQLAA